MLSNSHFSGNIQIMDERDVYDLYKDLNINPEKIEPSFIPEKEPQQEYWPPTPEYFLRLYINDPVHK